MATSQRPKADPRVQRDSSAVYSPQEGALSGSSDSYGYVSSEVSIYGKKPLPPKTTLVVTDDDYHMNHRNRGKAIIFNHEHYAENLCLNPREGTKTDRKRLKETLRKLGFAVQVLENPSKNDIMDKIKKETENHYHYSSDCLVVVVLTHGEENGTLYANDNTYTVSELLAPFMAETCPALATKPKIFIMQACRGDRPSRAVGVNMAKLTTDSVKFAPEDEPKAFSIPSEADVLVAYSTFEGRVAHRDVEDGTWYIDELCKELDENAKKDDLLTMLTRVNRKVALTKEHASNKQMPMIQSTLTRKIYFNGDRDKQNVPVSSVQEINDKLDRLLSLQESALAAAPPQPPRSSGSEASSPVFGRRLARPASGGGWDALRLWPDAGAAAAAPPCPLPSDDDAALRHARALRLLLEWRAADDDVQEGGRTLLALLSWWDVLDGETRKYAYRRAVCFLRAHGREWPVLPVVDVPDVGAQGGAAPAERPRRKSSRSSTPSVSSLSNAPKRPPFK